MTTVPEDVREYVVPTSTAEFKLTVKGSKFIGFCAPVKDEAEAVEFIRQRSHRFHNATHNCWAYRVGDPAAPIERSSDEGEPSGTAGRPILEQLAKLNLIGAALVVSRWFGGTRLGRGGLIRAYRDCTAETLKLLETESRHPSIELTVECDYDLVGMVERSTAKCKGYVKEGNYTDIVRLIVNIPVNAEESFRQILSEASAGRVRIIDGGNE